MGRASSRWTTFRDPGVWVGNFLPKLLTHQQQGTLDGACGVYCLAMIIEYFELEKSEDLIVGFRKAFKTSPAEPLLISGLSFSALHHIAKEYAGDELCFTILRAGTFEKARLAVEKQVASATPVIIQFQIESRAEPISHFAVAVGTGKSSIYLMDPSESAWEGTLYNNYIRTRNGVSRDMSGRRVMGPFRCRAITRTNFEPVPQELWLPWTLESLE